MSLLVDCLWIPASAGMGVVQTRFVGASLVGAQPPSQGNHKVCPYNGPPVPCTTATTGVCTYKRPISSNAFPPRGRSGWGAQLSGAADERDPLSISPCEGERLVGLSLARAPRLGRGVLTVCRPTFAADQPVVRPGPGYRLSSVWGYARVHAGPIAGVAIWRERATTRVALTGDVCVCGPRDEHGGCMRDSPKLDAWSLDTGGSRYGGCAKVSRRGRLRGGRLS